MLLVGRISNTMEKIILKDDGYTALRYQIEVGFKELLETVDQQANEITDVSLSLLIFSVPQLDVSG